MFRIIVFEKNKNQKKLLFQLKYLYAKAIKITHSYFSNQ